MEVEPNRLFIHRRTAMSAFFGYTEQFFLNAPISVKICLNRLEKKNSKNILQPIAKLVAKSCMFATETFGKWKKAR